MLKQKFFYFILGLFMFIPTNAMANELITENGDLYYKNDQGDYLSGLQKIDDNWYYFDENNDYKASSGWVDALQDGVMQKFYFDFDTKQAYSGIHEIDNKKYFFGIYKSKLMYGNITDYDGKKYYADLDSGVLVSGIYVIDGVSYFYGIRNNYLMEGPRFITDYDGNLYYVDENGIPLSGLQKIDDNWYYFDENNDYKASSGWVDALQDGVMQKFYFDFDTKQAYSGIHEIDNKKYFFGIYKSKLMYGNITDYDGKKYYADLDSGVLVSGIYVIDGVSYFYGIRNNYLMEGPRFINDYDGNLYYVDENGIPLSGLQKIDDNWYYFDENNDYKASSGWVDALQDGVMQKFYFDFDTKQAYSGIHEIDNKKYFFGIYKSKLMYGNITDYDGKKYYADLDSGVLVSGIYVIDGVSYFYGIKKNYLMTGPRIITDYDGNKYYTDELGILHKDMISFDGDYYYFEDDFKAVTGWKITDNGTYYFDLETAKRAKDVTTIDDKKYFFGIKYGKLMKGWVSYEGRTYYGDLDTGELYSGFKTIDSKDYYFGANSKLLMKGKFIVKKENKYYYSNPHNGVLVKNHEVIDGNDIYCDENGVLIKIQYNPVYYSQKDSRWSNRLYGIRKFGPSGCAPTSMAMAFSSILGKTILPTDVADYLYNNTNEYNKRSGGTGGMGIVYASNHFGIKYTPINNKEEMKQSLSDGKIIFAAMGNGKFGRPQWNHAIIIYKYDNGNGYALDPLNTNNNDWVSLDLIFREQSKDKDDSRGGSNFYALEGY